MKIEQSRWTSVHGWEMSPGPQASVSPDLVLVFGSFANLNDKALMGQVCDRYPDSRMTGCSTAGEICAEEVTDDSLVVTAIEFERTQVSGARISIHEVAGSFEAGKSLASLLDHRDLVHVFVLSDGLLVNGSDLVKGIEQTLPPGISVTGGLSGDGGRFEQTVVLWDGEPQAGCVVAVAFYGRHLAVGSASLGGWDSFGPERLVTRSKGNVLYELDNHSALTLYKTYLGEHAAGLPATGLLFPLSIRVNSEDTPVVRTILSVDEVEQSLTFAGDVREGAYARLMKANFDRLIDGAVDAARTSFEAVGSVSPDLAILISCVGRKMVLKQRVEEEVEGVRDVVGPSTVLTGFYSYGEISPFTPSAKCELHNQTMTITTLSERP